MRTVTIDLVGEARLLCHSSWASIRIGEAFGDVVSWAKSMDPKTTTEESRMSALFAMAEILMEAGARYDEAMGVKPHRALAADAMADLLDVHDMLELQRAVMDALVAGQRRTVGAEPPKNAMATPEVGDT